MQDIYKEITDKIIADLEKGVRPWRKPWGMENNGERVSLPLRACGKPYSGINVIMLWMSGAANGYSSPMWMTYKQAQEYGANVRKGEKGTRVVYANTIIREETRDNGETDKRAIPFLKAYTVFNVEQIDGLPALFTSASAPQSLPESERNATADDFFTKTRANIGHGGTRAYYSQESDCIQMPHIVSFIDSESYYATLAHEMIHWTKHPSRLDRDLGKKSWGDAGYAKEELVAEIGAAFLCAGLGISSEVREDHAAYIGSWITVLKNDKRAIFSAASMAQKAAQYLDGLQGAPLEIAA